MRDEKTRIAAVILVLAFLIILFFFRKIVKYPFCDLDEYSGKFRWGKSYYYFITHLILSLGLSIACFSLFTNNESLDKLFDNTIIRLGTIFIIWMILTLGIGWLIEVYLETTDKDYKLWKIKQQNKL